MLGCIVNYACHPVHHGRDGLISAGVPGSLAVEMKRRGCPVTLFLNGACGNTHTLSPSRGDYGMEAAALRLAEDAWKAIGTMAV